MICNLMRVICGLLLAFIPAAIPFYILVYISPYFKYYRDNRFLNLLDRVLFHLWAKAFHLWLQILDITIYQLGEDVSEYTNDPAVVISNHLNTLDSALFQKFAGDNLCRTFFYHRANQLFPGLSKTDQMRGHFIENPDSKDRAKDFADCLKTNFFPWNHWCCLYPESGLLKHVSDKSVAYAKANNLPIFKHVAVPRYKAVQAALNTLAPMGITADQLANEMRVKWLFDYTLIFSHTSLSVENLVRGKIIKGGKIYVHTKVYDVREIPRDDEGIRKWLFDRFQEKEEILEKYATKQVLPDRQILEFKFTLTALLYYTLYIYTIVTFILGPLLSFVHGVFF